MRVASTRSESESICANTISGALDPLMRPCQPKEIIHSTIELDSCLERLIAEPSFRLFRSHLKDETRNYLTEEMGRVHEAFQTLDRYDPKLTDALASLRRAAIPSKNDPGLTLETKYKELIMVAVEAAMGRGEKGKSHARKAIRAGATPKQVQESLALCIYLVGMSSWVDGGMECVLAAEEEQDKVMKGEKFNWTAEVGRR